MCPVPFPVPFHGLCAPASDFASESQQNLPETHFCWQGHEKVQKALERDWEQTRRVATVRTVAGTARRRLKTAHACASVGLRSPSTPSTVDGRNIQTLSAPATWTPSTPKLNVRGLARMFRRMDETNQTLETQIQSSYVQH